MPVLAVRSKRRQHFPAVLGGQRKYASSAVALVVTRATVRRDVICILD